MSTLKVDSITDSAGTGAPDFPNGLTGTVTGPVMGEPTGLVAAVAGEIGELIFANLPRSTPNGLVSGVAEDIVSITISPGHWQLSGGGGFSGTTASTTLFQWSISLTSATHAATDKRMNPSSGEIQLIKAQPAEAAGNDNAFFVFPPIFVSVSVSTTYYLVASANWTTSSLNGYGFLQARRVR